jgi:hypothetical protein
MYTSKLGGVFMDKEQALQRLEQLILKARETAQADIHSGRALGFINALHILGLITSQEVSVYVDRALCFDID